MSSSNSNTSVVIHDFHILMEDFVNEVILNVPCSGIRFKAENAGQHFLSGVLEQYQCCYEIKLAENSLGHVYFARDTQFMVSELTTLENMVAGLALPLYRLFLAKGSHENSQNNNVNQ